MTISEALLAKVKRIMADSPQLQYMETEIPRGRVKGASDMELIAVQSKSGEIFYIRPSARDHQEYVLEIEGKLPDWFFQDVSSRRPKWTKIAREE